MKEILLHQNENESATFTLYSYFLKGVNVGKKRDMYCTSILVSKILGAVQINLTTL